MSDQIQGSEEWFQARIGVVTASRFSDVLASVKSGEAAARYNYKAEIIAERLTGQRAESYTSPAMAWGNQYEAEARAIYATITGKEVAETGLVKHKTIKAGASPDGLVGSDGLIEIKCPNTATHIMTLLSEVAPKKYYAQMQGQMWITGRKWCDFVSYDPRLDPKRAIFITRVERDDDYIESLEDAVLDFLEEVDELITQLEGMK
jgi:putative phage-type endonuclease